MGFFGFLMDFLRSGDVLEVVGAAYIYVTLSIILLFIAWRTFVEVSSRKYRSKEEAEAKLIEERLEVFPGIMGDLQCLSYEKHRARLDSGGKIDPLKDPLVEKNQLDELMKKLNSHIYGKAGLIMNHITREFLVWLVKSLELYDKKSPKSPADAEKIRKISWKLHQLMRADLGVNQPALASALDGVKSKKKKHIAEKEIEKVFLKIKHNDWANYLMSEDDLDNGKDASANEGSERNWLGRLWDWITHPASS